MKRQALIVAGAVAAATAPCTAGAAEEKSVSFNRQDWELACDNTRTCRAAGYHKEEGNGAPVTVLLERQAGPGRLITAKVQLGHSEEDETAPASLTMHVDNRSFGKVSLDRELPIGDLSHVQTEALLQAVAGTGQVEWRAAQRRWILSGAGAAAVLLKMDEFQGRLGTRGAAIRKGPKSDDGALPAVPAPLVVPAAVPTGSLRRLSKEHERMLVASLRNTVRHKDCESLAEVDAGKNELALAPLTGDKMLVSTLCWRAAYNEGEGYWVANRTPPFAPQFVTHIGAGYDDGSITSSQRGRGLGGCWWTKEWVWDGRRFVHTAEASTGMCRRIAADGAWHLPTLVSKVRR